MSIVIVLSVICSAVPKLVIYNFASATSTESENIRFIINAKLPDGTTPEDKVFIAIHDYSGDHNELVSDRIIAEVKNLPFKKTLQVDKTPGHKGFYEFLIFVSSPEFSGSTFEIVQDESIPKTVNVEILLEDKPEELKTYGSNSDYPEAIITSNEYDVLYDWDWVNCGQVHSISHVRCRWYTDMATYQYFQGFTRDIWYKMYDHTGPIETDDSGWLSAGKKSVDSSITDYVEATGGSKSYVKAWTKFKCEDWYYDNFQAYDGYYWNEEYIVLTPIIYNAIEPGESVSCNICGSNHPAYAAYQTSGGANPFECEFDSGTQSAWFSTSVSLDFSFAWKLVSFGGSVSLYRQVTGTRPYVEVYIQSWDADKLYYWWDNDDADRHLLHVSWQ